MLMETCAGKDKLPLFEFQTEPKIIIMLNKIIIYLDNWAIINQTRIVVGSGHRRNVMGIKHVGHESLENNFEMIDGSLFS